VPILLQKRFALVIKISFGCTRAFRVKMWGTSSREDKLADDVGNVIEATARSGRQSDFFYSRKISTRQFGTFATKSAHCSPSFRQRHVRRRRKLTMRPGAKTLIPCTMNSFY
jgi:hypothetical protein